MKMKNLFGLMMCAICLFLIIADTFSRTATILERGPGIWVNTENGQFQEVQGGTALEESWKFLMYSPNTTITASALYKGPTYEIWEQRVNVHGFYFTAKVFVYTSDEIGAIENYPGTGWFERYNVYMKYVFAGQSLVPIEGWTLKYDSRADLNGDSKITLEDIDIITTKIKGGYDRKYDINLDGFLNRDDVIYVYDLLGASPDLKAEEAIPWIKNSPKSLALTLSPVKPQRHLATAWAKIKVAQ